MAVTDQASFFTRFKKRLTVATESDPGGRYFAVLLQQVFQESPDALRQILFPRSIKAKFSDARAFTERDHVETRRADLAFYDAQNNIIGLVEVKEDDQLAPLAGAQVDDYISYVKWEKEVNKRVVHFAFVTKHLPSRRSQEALARAKGGVPGNVAQSSSQ